MRHKWQGTGDRLPGREFVGLGTGSSSSLGIFRDRLPRERYRGSVGLGGFWGLAPRDRACARRKARGRGCFRAMREGVRCSPSTLAPARSRCRWVAFGDRLPGGLGTGCSRPVPLRLGVGREMEGNGDRLRSGGWESFRWGSAAPCLRSQEGSGKDEFSRYARGVGCSPSMLAPARSRCRWVSFRDRLGLLFRDRLRRAADTGYWGALSSLRGQAAGGSLRGQAAGGFQCSLRHDPAAAGSLLGTGCSCSLGTGYLGNC